MFINIVLLFFGSLTNQLKLALQVCVLICVMDLQDYARFSLLDSKLCHLFLFFITYALVGMPEYPYFWLF